MEIEMRSIIIILVEVELHLKIMNWIRQELIYNLRRKDYRKSLGDRKFINIGIYNQTSKIDN